MKKSCLALLLAVLMTMSATMAWAEGLNPAAYLKTDEQRASVATLTDVNDGKLYTMDYTADYQLDALLEASVADVEGMVRFLQETLLGGGTAATGTVDAGCSAFTAQSEEGQILYGRNFDYKNGYDRRADPYCAGKRLPFHRSGQCGLDRLYRRFVERRNH